MVVFVYMHVETCQLKYAVAFMYVCICVSVWIHVRAFGESSLTKIFQLRVIDINKKKIQATN